jgi:hypothetical protein
VPTSGDPSIPICTWLIFSQVIGRPPTGDAAQKLSS